MFFPNQMWLDGIFMADSFYGKWTHLYDNDNQTAWDDILLQYTLIESHARNESSGLLVHGWADGSAPWADPETGLAPHVWGRAVGWYFMSLVEVLQLFPTGHQGYDQLLGYFQSLAAALKKARDPESGSWWQVMEEPWPGAEGNFIESSCSSMFTFGLLKGISLGYISRDDYLSTARYAYLSVVDNFVKQADNGTLILEGTVDECNLADGNVNIDVSTSQSEQHDLVHRAKAMLI
jgi:rhamnogalacturonyl hydrolase YesR